MASNFFNLRKRRHSENELYAPLPPTPVQLNHDEPVVNIIFDSSDDKDSISELEVMDQRIISNENQIKSENLGLPKPIMNYLLQAANGKVMKKFQRTCKYFFQKIPYFIVDAIDREWMIVHGKCISIPETNMPEKIWVVKYLKIEDKKDLEVFKNIVRFDVINVFLPHAGMTMNQFHILTKSKRIKYWDSLLTSFVSENNYSQKDISIEDLLFKFPNATRICARVKSSPKNVFFTTRLTKIILLHLHIVDNIFDPDKYYKFLEKVIAQTAEVRLTFKYTSASVVAVPSIEEIKKLRNHFDNTWIPVSSKPQLTLYDDQMKLYF